MALSFQYCILQHILKTEEPQVLQKSNCACEFIGKSAVINIANFCQKLLVLTGNLVLTSLFVCLFVCLHARSVWRHTWVLMGPHLNRMLKPCFNAYKYADLVVYGSNRQEQIKVKGKRRERPRPLATNQVDQLYCQPLGQEKGKNIQFQVPLRLATSSSSRPLLFLKSSQLITDFITASCNSDIKSKRSVTVQYHFIFIDFMQLQWTV